MQEEQKKARRTALSKTHEPICLRLPFTTSDLGLDVLNNWQKTQTPLYHIAFNLLLDKAILKGKTHVASRRVKSTHIVKSKLSIFKRLRKKKTQFKSFGTKSRKTLYPDAEIVLGALKRAEGLFKSWTANTNCTHPPILEAKRILRNALQA